MLHHVFRRLKFLAPLALLTVAIPARPASSSFDLIGPRLAVTVTHDGVTLPLQQVPNLSEGDRISVKFDRPPGNGERYRIVAAFLRGAVVRPGKDWFAEAESWKPRSAELSLTVPKDAQQLALLIAPEQGGSASAIIDTIRKQPGAFVRAVLELNQASLDRARLDTFLREIQRAGQRNSATLATVSPTLTHSLSIKLKTECLQQPAETQAACLTVDRETLLLADSHSSSLADTLTGTPTDLALQLSTTPQAGYGAYSSYIGVVRDVFRLFGAFQSAQLQFIPALSQLRDNDVTVLLNTPLSFAKPTSVMVVAMPPIEAPAPLPIRNPDPDKALCAGPGLVLPVDGAPLIYATDYARNMTLRFALADGTQATIPVHADPNVGGFTLDGALPTAPFGPTVEARLRGDWGFAPFDGPKFTLSRPETGPWQAADQTSLVIGRSNDVELLGASAGCVTQVSMTRGDGVPVPISWRQASPRSIVASVPLDKADPGSVSILIDSVGRTSPALVTVRALREAGSLDDLSFHAQDDEAMLTGTRLDQVQSAKLGGVVFLPGALTRVGKQDRLALKAADSAAARALPEGKSITADVTFAGGRHRSVGVVVAPPLASVTLVRISAQTPPRAHAVPITLPDGGTFAQDARLTFAFHMQGPAPLTGRETIEIGTVDGRAVAAIQPGKGYDIQDVTTGIVTFVPSETLGPVGYGALRFRVLRNGEASRWAPLANAVRLPEVHTVTCTKKGCTISGSRLFLIKTLSPTQDFHDPQDLPDGFVASDITTHPSPDGRLFLKLRDAPDAVAVLGGH